MADKKYTELVAANLPLTGAEIIALVQSGVSKKTPVSNLPTSGKPVSASVSGSDFTTTSNVAANVTGLSIAVSANRKYRVLASLNTGCNSTGGIKIGFNGPAGSAILTGSWVGSATSISNNQQLKFTTMGTLSGTAFNRVNSANGIVTFIGYITTSVTAGNIVIQVASSTDTETSTVFIGSTFDLTEVQ